VLAAGKLAAREHLYRGGTSDAIVLAYRERALDACRILGAEAKDAAAVRAMNHPTEITMRVGDPSRPVMLWQVDREEWTVRFRNPQLLVAHRDRGAHYMCIYDVLTTAAHLMKS
jgi:hypothetical protein